MVHLLGICGSLRAASLNRLLLADAMRRFAADSETVADLRLPLYDGDVEAAGMPAPVTALADAVARASAIVIATPEYNKAPSGVLKNALDWISRVPGSPLRGKPVAIVSAADGRAGGDRAQFALRLWLVPFRAQVLPGPEVMVAHASSAFDAEGRLLEQGYARVLDELMSDLRTLV